MATNRAATNKAQRRAYLKIAKRVEDWTSKFNTHAIFMAVVNGQVLLAGNKVMKMKFAKDNRVKEVFMNTVLDGKSDKQKFRQTPIEEKIDFSQCSYKFLRCFISQALQVDRKTLKPQYLEGEKPLWWPKDVRFISPNHPPDAGHPLTLREMIEIAESYQLYIVTGESSHDVPVPIKPPLTEVSNIAHDDDPNRPCVNKEHLASLSISEFEMSTREQILPHSPPNTEKVSETQQDLLKEYTLNELSQCQMSDTPLTPLKDVGQTKCSLSPENALKMLSGISWIEFQKVVKAISQRLDPVFPRMMKTQTLKTISSRLVDRRHLIALKGVIPEGFTIAKSVADGNCLYGAVCVCLFGCLGTAEILSLRLLSVLHATEHFQEYVSKYTKEMSTVSRAHQFIAAVASSSEVFMNKPVTSSIKELMTYILAREIMETAKNGSYSGYLQIQFLSSAIGFRIQQHAQFHYDDFYQLMLEPCVLGCKMEVSTLHIMWLQFNEESSSMNHICPLIPQEAISESSNINVSSTQYFRETCVMKVFKQCIVGELHGEKTVDWIQCVVCQSWYHGVCVGLAVGTLSDEIISKFSCCTSSESPIITQGHYHQLRLSDIRSVYHHNGISDAIIDFFTRMILPDWTGTSFDRTVIVSALAYEAIKRGTKVNYKTVFGKINIQTKDVVGFPCKPRDVWHWILVAVVPQKKVAYIFDSMSNTLTDSNQSVVADLSKFYCSLMDATDYTLEPMPVPVVSQANGFDCGIHVLQNCITLSMCTGSTIVKEFRKATSVNTAYIRGQILLKCFLVTRSSRQTRSKKVSNKITSHKKIISQSEEGLVQINTPEKGRGVVATKVFTKGDILCEYAGDLLSHEEAIEQERIYEEDPTIGCYMYYFKYKTRKLCVDATKETGRLGRLVNHSKRRANVSTKIFEVKGTPQLWLVASRNIQPGEELLFDYNDKRPKVIKQNPWLAT